MFRKLLVFGAFLLSSVLLFSSPVLSVEGPRIYDCGEVLSGEIVKHDFILQNKGDTKIHILDIVKTCNCTQAFADSQYAAPGGTIRVSVILDTKGKKGKTSADVIIVTDSEQSELVLKVVMNCLEPDSRPEKNRLAGRIVRRMSRDFRQNYAREYVSKIRYIYTVEADNHFVDLLGYEGYVYSHRLNFTSRRPGVLQDKNRNLWYPESRILSMAWNPRGTDTLPSRSVVVAGRMKPDEKLATQYVDNPSVGNVTGYKRMLEVCSPLNPRQNHNYNYWIEREQNDLLTIGFRTKEGCFPRRTRLFASGSMVIDMKRNRIRQVKISDWVDYWTSFPYRRVKSIPRSITSHSLELVFASVGNRIVASYALFDVQWHENDKYESSDFYVSINRRRDPGKFRQKEHQEIHYMDHLFLSKALNKEMIYVGELGYTTMLAPYYPEHWTRETVPWLDWERLEKELGRGDTSLYKQAEIMSQHSIANIVLSREDTPRIEKRLMQGAQEMEKLF